MVFRCEGCGLRARDDLFPAKWTGYGTSRFKGAPMSEPQCEHEWERPWVQMVEGHATPVGAFRCRKCRAQRESVQEAVTTTQPPEPSVPLSAIRALVQQWEVKAHNIRIIGDEDFPYEQGVPLAVGYRRCAAQLAALCPAPPEDQP